MGKKGGGGGYCRKINRAEKRKRYYDRHPEKRPENRKRK